MLANDPSGDLTRLIGPRIPSAAAGRALFFERFDLRFQTVYTASLIVSVLGGACMLGPYLFLALRRVYGEPARRLAWKAGSMILFAIVLDSIVSFLAVLVTIRLV